MWQALFIGINYVGMQGELSGCHNDVIKIKKFVTEQGYDEVSPPPLPPPCSFYSSPSLCPPHQKPQSRCVLFATTLDCVFVVVCFSLSVFCACFVCLRIALCVRACCVCVCVCVYVCVCRGTQNNMLVLMDDGRHKNPTHDNILEGIR